MDAQCPNHPTHCPHLLRANFQAATVTEICCYCGQTREERRPPAFHQHGTYVPAPLPSVKRQKKPEE